MYPLYVPVLMLKRPYRGPASTHSSIKVKQIFQDIMILLCLQPGRTSLFDRSIPNSIFYLMFFYVHISKLKIRKQSYIIFYLHIQNRKTKICCLPFAFSQMINLQIGNLFVYCLPICTY